MMRLSAAFTRRCSAIAGEAAATATGKAGARAFVRAAGWMVTTGCSRAAGNWSNVGRVSSGDIAAAAVELIDEETEEAAVALLEVTEGAWRCAGKIP